MIIAYSSVVLYQATGVVLAWIASTGCFVLEYQLLMVLHEAMLSRVTGITAWSLVVLH